MDNNKTINYKGKRIYYMDFSNLKKQEDILQVINESASYIRRQPLNSVIALTNIENMFFNSNIRGNFLTFLKKNKPHIKRSAIIGMSSIQRFLVNGLMAATGRDVRSFENETLAKDYIID